MLWQSSRWSRPKSKQLPLFFQHLAFLLLKAPLSFSPLYGYLLSYSLFPFCVFVFWIVLHLDSSAQIFFVHFLSRIFLPPGPIIGERIGFKGNAYQSLRETVASNHSAVSLCLSFFPSFPLLQFLSWSTMSACLCSSLLAVFIVVFNICRIHHCLSWTSHTHTHNYWHALTHKTHLWSLSLFGNPVSPVSMHPAAWPLVYVSLASPTILPFPSPGPSRFPLIPSGGIWPGQKV